MAMSMAASHSKGKFATDKIFGASGAAAKACELYGKGKVTNATIGSIMDEEENLACIPTVAKVLRELPINEMVAYAPIAGLPDYLTAAMNLAFADHRPDAYTSAVATAGGTGGIHHTIWNYTEIGDTVLTSDWFWGPYNVLCTEAKRKLATYTLFDENQNFNIGSFESKVDELLQKQDSILIIINTPAHNPTGYSLTDEEWAKVLDVCKAQAKKATKKITVLVDIAYIDYAGEKNECRRFLKQFGNLPENILGVLTFSMSKGYTLYGQRTGAMISISSSKEVSEEFAAINQYTSRATWSNINRGAMRLLTTIDQDKALLQQFEAERDGYYQMIRDRADIFMSESKACGLNVLPYRAGFFISIPAADPDAVCDKLHEDLIFAVPLKMGVRIAVCAIPSAKVKGIAAKTLKAMQFVDGK